MHATISRDHSILIVLQNAKMTIVDLLKDVKAQRKTKYQHKKEANIIFPACNEKGRFLNV
uniref:Uncharacterized protein n=1 Tax=Arion vulgaris TaxID=1028688 RepID=A0A0B7AAU0_9EUPU